MVIDEAHRFVDRLRGLAETIQSTGKRQVHLLVAARDTDWQASGGAMFHWSRLLVTSKYDLNGVDRPDAVAIISAWESIGPRALGALSDMSSRDERIDALMAATRDENAGSEGSLLGALLTTRYGPGLRDHVRELVDRVGSWRIPGGTTETERTLLDALIYVALPHANGIHDLTIEVLAQALGVTEAELHAYVLAPLGQEAAISYTSRRVLIRHRLIAYVLCEIAEERGYNLERAIENLVTAAALRMEDFGYDKSIAALAYMSSHLNAHSHLQLVAAQAAVDAVPRQLSYRTSLSAAYRKAGNAAAAVSTNVDALFLLRSGGELTGVRSYLNEWGVAEGNLQNWSRNAILVGLSLQDSHAFGPLSSDNASYAIGCLLLAFKKLYEANSDRLLLGGLAATVVLAEQLAATYSKQWVTEAELLVDRNAGDYPSLADGKAIQRNLAAAFGSARASLESALPGSLPNFDPKFARLVELAQTRSGPLGTRA